MRVPTRILRQYDEYSRPEFRRGVGVLAAHLGSRGEPISSSKISRLLKMTKRDVLIGMREAATWDGVTLTATKPVRYRRPDRTAALKQQPYKLTTANGRHYALVPWNEVAAMESYDEILLALLDTDTDRPLTDTDAAALLSNRANLKAVKLWRRASSERLASRPRADSESQSPHRP